jgi:UDP-glucose 4-epimerase
MNILITGGLSYVGSSIAQHFQEQGHNIRLLVKTMPETLVQFASTFDVMHGDILDITTLHKACENIDVVIHCAALNYVQARTKPQQSLLTSGYGTRNILEAATHANVETFIYVSTFHVYGKSEGNITETTTTTPTNNYSISKLVGEHYCHQYQKKINTTILRLTNVYGTPTHPHINCWNLVMNDLCKQAKQGKIILHSSGKQQRDFVSLQDINQAITLILEHQATGTFNVGGNNTQTIQEIAQQIAHTYKERYVSKVHIEAPEGKDMPSLHVDITKLQQLGYTPHNNIKETIHNILHLLQEEKQ